MINKEAEIPRPEDSGLGMTGCYKGQGGRSGDSPLLA